VDSHRRGTIEPGEECQFLHVVSEAVDGIEDRRSKSPAQRVTDLEVVLTTRLLSNVAPGRDWIVAERVVHPFRYFVGHIGDVGHRAHKDFAGVKIRGSDGLLPARIMEAENAALRTRRQ